MTKQNKKSSGMKKLVEKVLTNKKMRNAAMMSAFVVTAANTGQPWSVTS